MKAPPRPNFNQSIRALLSDVVATMPQFAHVQPGRILVVAGDARRASRGSVRPLAFAGGKRKSRSGRRKPLVRIKGRRMLYVITLRPLFFRASTPQARIETLLHELFHISRKFDGTLSSARRHARLGERFARRFQPLVREYLARCPRDLLAAFAYDGEVKVLQWLERPSSTLERGSRELYTEEHLYWGIIRMLTRRSARASVGLLDH